MTTIELLERFDQDDDFDSDLGKSQHKYLLAVLDQMKVRDKEKKLSRKERAEQAELKRIQGVRRMLSRAASQRCGTSDEQDLYKLLSKYDGAINAVIDGLGNTAAHWVTNLNKKVKKTMSDDQEFWSFEDATPSEREASESWLDVAMAGCFQSIAWIAKWSA